MASNEYVKTLKTSDGAIIIYPETMASAVYYVDPNNEAQQAGVVIREGTNKNSTVQEKLASLEAAWANPVFKNAVNTNDLIINGKLYFVNDEDSTSDIQASDGVTGNTKVLVLKDGEDKDEVRYTTLDTLFKNASYLALSGGIMDENATVSLTAPMTEDKHAINKEYLEFNFINNFLKRYVNGGDKMNFTLYPQNTDLTKIEAPNITIATSETLNNSVNSLIIVKDTTPSDPGRIGTLWIDTGTGADREHYLRYWNGKMWTAVPVAWT